MSSAGDKSSARDDELGGFLELSDGNNVEWWREIVKENSWEGEEGVEDCGDDDAIWSSSVFSCCLNCGGGGDNRDGGTIVMDNVMMKG